MTAQRPSEEELAELESQALGALRQLHMQRHSGPMESCDRNVCKRVQRYCAAVASLRAEPKRAHICGDPNDACDMICAAQHEDSLRSASTPGGGETVKFCRNVGRWLITPCICCPEMPVALREKGPSREALTCTECGAACLSCHIYKNLYEAEVHDRVAREAKENE